MDQIPVVTKYDEEQNELHANERPRYQTQTARMQGERRPERNGRYDAEEYWHAGLSGEDLAMKELGQRIWPTTV